MADVKNDYLSMAASELAMQQALLTSLIEYWHGDKKDNDRLLVTENLLYILEGGLERTWELLEQESRHRMTRGKQ
ncbi:hypothetical protein [Serratia fonticola]|uniref:hypothetical protein n=1 Tax=Serratia fonticola TaxID=47917 RepID=UPI0027F99A61|nr:hypothetical protein [Serratia fonticola]MDQ7209882.1 hypothetical protein [Serratia fonticola]HBE9079252.1 hypothetical protein [Serratia fonticola]HBE9091622.1 hypothetical protein [Serratia fonticola]HBE9151025.1 hypothetical protein [Serratia fonticola]